jgi:hypothetical protein
MEEDHNPHPEDRTPTTDYPIRAHKTTKRSLFRWLGIMALAMWLATGTTGSAILLIEIAKDGRNEPATRTDSSPVNIYDQYQQIIDQFVELNRKDIADLETKERIERLSKEIVKLRTLNSYYKFKEIQASFIPSGIPSIYGEKLGISFDRVQEAIDTVAAFGPTYGGELEKIKLTGTNLETYIRIGSQISCQYCCNAATLVTENGDAACGCEHSIMMRGLAAYLIKHHSDMSDAEILKELRRWKIAFFPKQTLSQRLLDMEKAGAPGIREVLDEFPEFLPDMVGGC